ncbi:MAG TPA: methylenetetrahydrofolate reductase [NAD(P)H] [Candidatus Avacidaminococcus intestinavium]|uniref:Methylenetetrahydrofolate reductase n=1 Tax=Candidatus Avacidaminococcus intestinavium TaxID=2840684 RepID=A0A9D1MQY4_9FIRM|nr:methylenetetrahydrofolate reductase [NAD(P)H] [Candidatus Avacidaminococcus intestinavium]
MKITNLFNTKKHVISFEVFPPKISSPFETVLEAVDALHVLKPDFISVTYGAGGTTSDKTLELAHHIKEELGIETLAHLTCITNSLTLTEQILDKLTALNLENILALRGDPPQDLTSTPRNIHASDLIKQIKQRQNFCIAAAAYPEGHPETLDRQQDLRYLKTKTDAGAEFLITQIVFDNDYLKTFREDAYALGIKVPISVGIMPVFSASQIKHISNLCGATLPKALQTMLEKYSHNQDALQSAGIEYACRQIDDLLANGFEGIHIYTMNRPLLARALLSGTGLAQL